MNRILITGGKIVDGAGNPWFFGDLLIEDDAIAAIAPSGSIESLAVDEVVDPGVDVVGAEHGTRQHRDVDRRRQGAGSAARKPARIDR